MMWSREVLSGRGGLDLPEDVFRHLLGRLVDRRMVGKWVHVEVVASRGWFMNALSGGEPFVEIVFRDDDAFELNPGVPKRKRVMMPRLSVDWVATRDETWKVPVADVERLIAWSVAYLAAACECSEIRVRGWLDG